MPDTSAALLDPYRAALIAGSLLAGLMLDAPAQAQQILTATPGTACGAASYNTGQPNPATGDTKGNLCVDIGGGTVTAVVGGGTVGASQVGAYTVAISAGQSIAATIVGVPGVSVTNAPDNTLYAGTVTAGTGAVFGTGAHTIFSGEWDYTGTATAWALGIDAAATGTNGAVVSPFFCHLMGPGPGSLAWAFPGGGQTVTTGVVMEISTGTGVGACGTIATAAAGSALVGAAFK